MKDRTREDQRAAVQPTSTEGQVVAALLERHLSALETYVRLHAGAVVRQRESCADICQSVCREVLEGVERFEYRGEAEFRHWLFTAARSKLIDRLRFWRADRRDPGREVAAGTSPARAGRLEDDLRALVPSPSQHAMAREDWARFERAFAKLSAEQQEIVSLSRLAGFSHRQIAECTGHTEESCRQELHRALVRIARHLERDDGA